MSLSDKDTGMAGDDTDNNNPMQPVMRILGKLMETFGGESQKPGEKPREENPLLALIKGLFNFIKLLFSRDADADAPDFADTPPEQREAARREYQNGRQAEEAKLPQFRESVKQGLTPGKALTIPNELLELRRQSEAANGGQRILSIMPVGSDGRITEDFGHRHAPKDGASTNHKGIDVASRVAGGTPDIIAPMPGKILGVGMRGKYGMTIELEDIYGVTHRLAHLQDNISVKAGDTVIQGQKIGVMGKTGNVTGVHLHYEQRDPNGVARDPVIAGRTWDEDQKFTLKDTKQLIASQSQRSGAAAVAGSSPSIDTQLAQLNLGGTVSHSTGYVAPVQSTTGAKQTGKAVIH